MGQANARSSQPATAGSLCGTLLRAFDFSSGTGEAAFPSWLIPFWFIYYICFLFRLAWSSAHQCATRPESGVSPLVRKPGKRFNGYRVLWQQIRRRRGLYWPGSRPRNPDPRIGGPSSPRPGGGRSFSAGSSLSARGLELSSRSPTPGLTWSFISSPGESHIAFLCREGTPLPRSRA